MHAHTAAPSGKELPGGAVSAFLPVSGTGRTGEGPESLVFYPPQKSCGAPLTWSKEDACLKIFGMTGKNGANFTDKFIEKTRKKARQARAGMV